MMPSGRCELPSAIPSPPTTALTTPSQTSSWTRAACSATCPSGWGAEPRGHCDAQSNSPTDGPRLRSPSRTSAASSIGPAALARGRAGPHRST